APRSDPHRRRSRPGTSSATCAHIQMRPTGRSGARNAPRGFRPRPALDRRSVGAGSAHDAWPRTRSAAIRRLPLPRRHIAPLPRVALVTVLYKVVRSAALKLEIGHAVWPGDTTDSCYVKLGRVLVQKKTDGAPSSGGLGELPP